MRTPLLAIIMAGIGFGLVYYWDAAGHKRPARQAPAVVSSSASQADDGPTLSELYHKLVDRFWDRDMPTKKKKGMPLLPKMKTVAAQKPTAQPEEKSAGEKPPTRYRQQSEGLPVARMRREQKKRNQRQRIEAILDTVGVQ